MDLGEYTIKAFAEVPYDENLNNNQDEKKIRVLPDAPDVEGWYNWDSDKKPIVNQPYNLSFIIKNNGFKDAEDVGVSLYKGKGGDIIGTSNLGIVSKEPKKVSFLWTPKSAGYHNFLLVLNTTNDGNLDNNIYEFFIRVLSENVDVDVSTYWESSFVVNKEGKITAYIENEGGKDAFDVIVSLYGIDSITNEESLLEKKNVKYLESGKDTEVVFHLTSSDVGFKKFKIRADVKDDVNLENNYNVFDIKILPQSRLKNLGNKLEGYLLLEIQKNEKGEWKKYKTIIDDLSNKKLRLLEKNEQIVIDKLFEKQGDLKIKDAGNYKVYVALLNEEGETIRTIDGKNLEASYQFNKVNSRSEPVPAPQQLASMGGNRL